MDVNGLSSQLTDTFWARIANGGTQLPQIGRASSLRGGGGAKILFSDYIGLFGQQGPQQLCQPAEGGGD